MFARSAQQPGTDVRPRVLLAEYDAYRDAQAAVDQLSDRGFPVEGLTIVWDRLRLVEDVTGRRTTLNAFVEGALPGAWFGGFIGLFLLLFVQIDEGVNALALLLTYVIVGALLGGIWRGATHWLQRGARDFGTFGRMEADRYQVWVDPELEARAATDLGVAGRGPVNP